LTCHYAPQLQVLPRARAFVTHGGANSVMEALHFGVPLLISPVCNDQFHQAHYIQRRGCGQVLDLHRTTVDECRATLDALLYDESLRAALRPITASYQRDGAAEAASLIERHG
jgi:UDP:flavonoid glycosyltransferase YjiC (YdhE family)